MTRPLLAVAAATLATTAYAAPDRSLLAAARAARPAQLALLEQIVSMDSGTGDAAGAARVQAVLAARLRALGATIEMVPAEAAGLGDNLVARLAGTGRGRILVIGHIDTVFPAGTAAARPFRSDGTRAYGPGVADEKGGVVEAVTALELLHRLGRTGYKSLTLLVETSEETGSPGTHALIARLLKDADVELNVEPGDAPDALTVWRKGSATIHLDVRGKAAHAGIAPQDGHNAATELLHQLRTVDRFPQTGTGITANLTTLKAGDRVNVIPDHAEADVNYRVRTPAQFAEVRDAFEAAARAPAVPGTSVTVSVAPSFPPLEANPATDALAARATAIYAELGRPLTATGNGGASESALAALGGVPALDGLGPVGGGFHSDAEWLDLATVTPRTYLLARLISDLGANPPPRR